MSKLTVFISMGFLGIGLFFGCGSKDNNRNGVSDRYPNYDCLNNPYGYCEQYGAYGQYGMYAYPDYYNYGGVGYTDPYSRYSNGFCCGSGRNPIYYPNNYGLMCMDGGFGYPYHTWNYQSTMAYPQPLNNGCTWDLGRGCDPRVPNQCNPGVCQPTAPGSTVGVCIRY